MTKTKTTQTSAAALRTHFAGLLALLLTLTLANSSTADLVWLKGVSEPLSGRILEQSESELKLQKLESGKFGATIVIKMNKVAQLVSNIDHNRLESLHPSSPEAYRDYAEELSAQRKDPSAIALARRLYLIAAFHAEEMLKISSISGLIQLSESEAELQDLRMLRFLHDPREATVFAPKPDSPKRLSLRYRKQMLELVRLLRTDQLANAAKILNSKEAETLVANWSDKCSYDELVRMTEGNRISKVQLSKLLAIEIELIYSNSADQQASIKQKKWSDFALQRSDQSTFDSVSGKRTSDEPKKVSVSSRKLD